MKIVLITHIFHYHLNSGAHGRRSLLRPLPHGQGGPLGPSQERHTIEYRVPGLPVVWPSVPAPGNGVSLGAPVRSKPGIR
jgi:hypothetical protein